MIKPAVCHKRAILWGFAIGFLFPWIKHFIFEKKQISGDFFMIRSHPDTSRLAGTSDATPGSGDSEQLNNFRADGEAVASKRFEAASKWDEGKRIRLLCWFMTDPKILKEARNVKDTWTKQCDVRLFMSSTTDLDFPTVGLNVSSGRSHIAAKSRASWTYIYEHYLDQADYFMKADPDSYIVVDNLKMFLSYRDPDVPEAFGHALFYEPPAWMGNFSGFYTAGQSVVLSRESVRRLAAKGIDTTYFVDGQAEDLKTIVCLEKRGGYLIDTRDTLGRETFMPAIGLVSTLTGNFPDWYTGSYRKHLGYCERKECLSHFPIVFHYVNSEMYLLDYLVNGRHQLQQRKAFVEESDAQGYFLFNGSILAEITMN